MVNQTILPEMTVSGHHYVDEWDSWSNEVDMVQVELIVTCILSREKSDALLRQQNQ